MTWKRRESRVCDMDQETEEQCKSSRERGVGKEERGAGKDEKGKMSWE